MKAQIKRNDYGQLVATWGDGSWARLVGPSVRKNYWWVEIRVGGEWFIIKEEPHIFWEELTSP